MTEIDVAVEAARAAGAILQRYPEGGGGRVAVSHKGAVDLVTEVDLACEAAIREVLARHTPDIPVLGEEGAGEGSTAPTRWVVDPLDGTTNFVHGFPFYCVSVALEVDGRSEVGVVLDPVRDRLYRAVRGQGARCDAGGSTRPMQVSATDDLSRALVATGFPYDRRGRLRFLLDRVEAVLSHAQGLRRAGAAALDLAMIADGRLDAFWEYGLHRWDVAAGVLLVREAGGVVTTPEGDPPDGDVVSILASSPGLHDAMRHLLR